MVGVAMLDDDKKEKKAKERKPKSPPTWRFIAGLCLGLYALGLGFVPSPDNAFALWGTGVGVAAQVASAVLLFWELLLARAAKGGKKWRTYLIAALLFAFLASGVTTGFRLAQLG